MAKTKNQGALDGLTADTDEDKAALAELKAETLGELSEDDFPEQWTPPQMMAAPEPRPGHVQRWCRWSVYGQADPQNRAARESEGWRPRRIETISEEDRVRFTFRKNEQHGDILVNGALVLCEMPVRLAKQRNAYYQHKNERVMQAAVVDQIADTNRSANAAFGKIELDRTSRSSVGRRHIVQADG